VVKQVLEVQEQEQEQVQALVRPLVELESRQSGWL
jgi:hypothetical protein